MAQKPTKYFFKSFNSLQALIAEAQKPTANILFNASRLESESNTKFSGCKTFDDAIDLARAGWPDGLKMLKESEKKLAANGCKDVKKMFVDFVGFAPNVPMYLQGSPVNMFNQRTIKARSKVVKILYDVARDWRVPTEKIAVQGAKVLALIESLERGGVRVQLDLICSVGTFFETNPRLKEAQIFITTIKRADQPVNRNTLAYSLMHGSFLRRLIFAAYEHNGDKYELRSNYGCPLNLYFLKKMQDEGKISKDYKIIGDDTTSQQMESLFK